MITRQKLYEVRARMKKEQPGFNEGAREVVLMLVDQCLLLDDAVNGGQPQRDWAAERAAADRQVRLALDDLRAVIQPLRDIQEGALVDETERVAHKADYTAGCIDQMLRAKTAWAREWAHYQPKIEEEFGV